MSGNSNDIHAYAAKVGVDHDTAITHLLLFEIVGSMALDDDKQKEAFEGLVSLVDPRRLAASVRELAKQMALSGEGGDGMGNEAMTRDEMKDLIRSLSQDDLETLRYLAMFGVDDWDRKTTVNGKPWKCPGCGAEGLLEVVDRVVETWAAEEMTLHGDYEYDLKQSWKWDSENHGDLYVECVKCQERFEVDELEEMFGLRCDEEEDDDEEDELE